MRSPDGIRRALLPALAAALGAAALAAGCGGSSGAATSSTQATTGTAGSTSAASTAPHASLKVATVPKYAKPSASAPVQGGIVQVAYRNITINPDVLRVKAGTTVRWTNFDPVEHDVTAESGPQRFASRTFGEGQTFQVTLAKPGVYHYECTIHPTTMNGTIEVVR